MGAPVIWNGKNAKLLNSGGLLDAMSQPFPRTGVKNYVEAWASNASGWTASGSGITVATDTTASDLPRANTTGTGIKLTGVSGSTAYAYVRFTLDAADYNVKQQLQFALNGTLGSNASGNFRVDVYSNTASNYGGTYTRLPLSTDSPSVSSLPALEGTYKTIFDAPGALQQWIEVRIGLNAAVTTSLVISDLIVGPGTQVQGAAVTGWQSYTPTFSAGFGAVSASNFQWRRVGDSVEIRGTWTVGTVSGTTATVTIPSALTVLSSVSASYEVAGTWVRSGNMGVAQTDNVIITANNGFVNFSVGSTTSGGLTATTGNNMCGNAETLSLFARIPVNELAGSGTLNVSQNDVEYYSSSSAWGTINANATAVYGPAGTQGGTTTPSLNSFSLLFSPLTPISATTSLVLKVSPDQIHWQPTGSACYTSGFSDTIDCLRFDGTNFIGAGVSADSTGKICVVFGKYPCGSGTQLWNGTWYWRVEKAAAGQAIGWGIVQPGIASGLVSASGVPGNTTGNAIASGYVGEFVQSKQSSVSIGTSLTQAATISLSAGVWMLSASAALISGGGGQMQLCISGTTASSAGTTTGYDNMYFDQAASSVGGGVIPCKVINISSSSTPYYLNISSPTAGTYSCALNAVRIA